MKYGIINPVQRTVTLEDHKDFQAALKAAGLQKGSLDHGGLARDPEGGVLGIAVDGFGLFKPPATQHYFAIQKKLYAGAAVIYREFEDRAVDILKLPAVRWFQSSKEVEQAVEMGEIVQPSITMGDEVLWVWPQPAPGDIAAAMKEASK